MVPNSPGGPRRIGGAWIAAISAILLFVFMFFHWFGVEATNNSNLLFAVRGGGPGKNAWEALEYIPIFLVATIIGTLTLAGLRLIGAVRKPPVLVHALVAVLGFVSMLIILLRIVDPPTFGTEELITFEGTVQLPIFLALAAAAGIVFGGCLAIQEEGRQRSSVGPT